MSRIITLLVAFAITTPLFAASPRGEVLDFTASWCGPCQRMSPMVSRLQRQGYPIRKVDVDANRALARQFNIRSIPAFILVVDGREVRRIEGSTTEQQIMGLIAQIPRTQPTAPTQPRLPKGVMLTQQGVDLGQPSQLPSNGYKTASNTPARSHQSQNGTVTRGQSDDQSASTQVDAFAASVRIRVKDDTGMNLGSGTIIESQTGKATVLTCGHIFRDVKPTAEILVDVFRNGVAQTYKGKLVIADQKADLGLITIPTPDTLPVAKIAGAAQAQEIGQLSYCVGCSGGEKPTKQQMRITRLNPYKGPANTECTGLPVQGRSGGGLFTTEGKVLGVCIAADGKKGRGLYTGLAAVQQFLDQAQLAYLYDGTSPGGAKPFPGGTQIAENSAAPPFTPAASKGAPKAAAQELDRSFQSEKDIIALQDALAQSGEAEVICIVRPLDNPNATSRVVVINRASSKFVSYLNGELHEQPRPTSRRIELADRPRAVPVLKYRPRTQRQPAPPRQVSQQFPPRQTQQPKRYASLPATAVDSGNPFAPPARTQTPAHSYPQTKAPSRIGQHSTPQRYQRRR